jgi:hypothetical protein
MAGLHGTGQCMERVYADTVCMPDCSNFLRVFYPCESLAINCCFLVPNDLFNVLFSFLVVDTGAGVSYDEWRLLTS